MKREKHFWKKLFCFVFLFTVVTGCGSVYAAEHGTVEEKETEDRSGMLEDELEQMEESLLDEFDFRQIDQLSGETELGEKVRFRDLTEMLISGNTKELGEIIYVFLTIFLYLLKCPQSLILSALRAFCFCGKPHISRSIFLYFRYQSWLKSW